MKKLILAVILLTSISNAESRDKCLEGWNNAGSVLVEMAKAVKAGSDSDIICMRAKNTVSAYKEAIYLCHDETYFTEKLRITLLQFEDTKNFTCP